LCAAGVAALVVVAVVGGAGRGATAEPGRAGRAGGQRSALEIPDPTDTTAVVTVKVGGDRTATDTVGPLEGVTLGLFADADDSDPIAEDWARCTSDGDGDCNFEVPETQVGGVNRDIRPWVREISPADGWSSNPALRTGEGDGTDSEATVYQFPTPGLQAGFLYSSTSDFMIDSSIVRDASGGVWQQSRENPTIDGRCGLDVALLLDISGSVADSLDDLKQAADTFVDSLVGTPSSVALFSFSTGSPGLGADQNHPDLMPVSTQSSADDVKALYADWDATGGTNWDQGLFQMAELGPDYPLAIVITDGNPTYFGDPVQGDGSSTRFREVENGIFSANAVKAEGTRVLAFGVGSGVEPGTMTDLNLAAISGPTAFDGTNGSTADYFQTDDYAAAGAALRELALDRCLGSLSIVKEIVPAENQGEDVTGAVPAGEGWQMDATTTTPGIGGLPDSRTTDDSGTGTVAFDLTYPADTPSASVQVSEVQHDDHTIVTQGGHNAVCFDLSSGLSVAVTDDESDPSAPGFTVDVPRFGAISCTVYNKPNPTPPTTSTATTSTSTTSTSTTSSTTSTTSSTTSTTSTSTTSTSTTVPPTSPSSVLPTSSVPHPTTSTPPTTEAVATRNLPRTGTSHTGWLLAAGGGLLALGVSLAAFAHRRRFG
jgi:LPXTG-motif cell wall-anchored protein